MSWDKLPMKGEEIMDNKIGDFCEKCGTKLIDGVCLQCAALNKAFGKEQAGKYQDFFRSSDEKMVAVLGESYFDDYMNKGVLKNGFAVLSDKRLYLNGKYYNVTVRKNGTNNYQQISQEKTLDLRDIVGVGFEDTSRRKWFILSIVIALLCIPVAAILAYIFVMKLLLPSGTDMTAVNMDGLESIFNVVFIILLVFGALFWFYSIYMSIKETRTYITIQYAGGIVAFRQTWYSDSDMEQFQNFVHITKDSVISENSKTIASKAETFSTQKASVADEISKLNELLAQGILSQEEFDKAKKELLGL